MTEPETGQGEAGAEFESAHERRAVGRQLAKAARGIEAMRGVLWMCAVVGVLWALGAWGLWSIAGGTLAAVSVAGALQIRKRPALWALVFALALTPIGLFALGAGIYVADYRGVVGGFVMVAGAWTSVRVMRRAEELMKAHPDHFGARRIRGEKRRKNR